MKLFMEIFYLVIEEKEIPLGMEKYILISKIKLNLKGNENYFREKIMWKMEDFPLYFYIVKII